MSTFGLGLEEAHHDIGCLLSIPKSCDDDDEWYVYGGGCEFIIPSHIQATTLSLSLSLNY